MLGAVCDLVAEVHAVERTVPALTAMCADCDVELFLVLPRLVLLCFAAEPERERRELVRSLLPHRFLGCDGEDGRATTPPPGPELEGFIGQFRNTMQLLAEASPARERCHSSADTAGWEVLMRPAIAGAGDSDDEGNATDATPQGARGGGWRPSCGSWRGGAWSCRGTAP